MGKYVFTGVDGHLVSTAAEFASTLAKPDDKLVFTSPFLDRSVPEESKRKWTDKGVEICYLSYDDVPSMEEAFKDAEAVGLVSTLLAGRIENAQMLRAIEIAKRVGVKRLCYTSLIGAGQDNDKNVPPIAYDHHCIEKAILASGLQWNIQRNNFYFENFFALLYPQVHWYCEDLWYWSSEGIPSGFVAMQDCGRVHGALVMGKGEPNKSYQVTGPELVSDYDLAKMVQEHTGWNYELVKSNEEDAYKFWASKGLPRDKEGDFSKTRFSICQDDMIHFCSAIRDGTMKQLSDTVELLTGQRPLSARDSMFEHESTLPGP